MFPTRVHPVLNGCHLDFAVFHSTNPFPFDFHPKASELCPGEHQSTHCNHKSQCTTLLLCSQELGPPDFSLSLQRRMF